MRFEFSSLRLHFKGGFDGRKEESKRNPMGDLVREHLCNLESKKSSGI
jgi:hypothetical protein